ncbi:aminotransferase class IV [Paenibacillus koleovorans]|uniref:aminotransferase class IV n=1 Tax=Paenibacillus koleovorans TaxID=121608 RepID=UPI001FE618D3|nr:aminotransferase class IV [Paenibacillus koleovorans]
MDEQEAVVSVFDHGFLYGMGLFETFRTYGGAPFLLKEHLERLEEGCRLLAIDYRPDEDWIRQQVATLLEANGLEDGYVRLSVSAGAEALGLPTEPYTRPNECIYMKALPPRDMHEVLRGKPLQLLHTPRSTPETPVRLKSFHYMNNIEAKRELSGYPWAKGAEGLFLDAGGYAVEGIVSNLFLVRERRLCTPHPQTGLLSGITRAYVLDLAMSIGLPVEEGLYTWSDVIAADEVFVTSSIQEIVPIRCAFDLEGNETLIGEAAAAGAGTWTRRLIDAYGHTGGRRGNEWS